MTDHDREVIREIALRATRHWPDKSLLGISPPPSEGEVTVHMSTDSRALEVVDALHRDGYKAAFIGNGGVVVTLKEEPMVRRSTLRVLIYNSLVESLAQGEPTEDAAERATDAVMGVIPRG